MGLDRYYELAAQSSPGLPPRDPDGRAEPRPWLPALVLAAGSQATPGLLEAAASGRVPAARATLELDVQGLHCAACVWVIRALYERHPGGHALVVNPGLGRLTLTFDPTRFPLEAWLDQLQTVGYRTGPPMHGGVDGRARAASDGLGLRLGITLAIAMNAMALSLSTYFGLERGDPDGLYDLFGFVNFGLACLAMVVAAPVFLKGAWLALRHHTLHLDVPIALGVVLAFGGSVALFFGGRPELAYFDTLDVFLALMLLGRWAQRRFLDTNRRLLLDDDGFRHARVKIVAPSGALDHRPLAELEAGDRFLVAPGELVPVAADIVANGQPFEADLAWISGESEPHTFEPGSIRAIPAGAHNVGRSAAVLLAREPFSASTLHALLGRVSPDVGTNTNPNAFWQRLTIGWVVTVLAFAAVTALVWAGEGASEALRHATAVLVVTCPCAIGLATPLAYELAQLRLKRLGLLVRRPGVLDRAQPLRHVVFDKTGTLTLSDLALSDPDALRSLPADAQERLWQLTARSNHPKSRAIHKALAELLPDARLDDGLVVTETPGVGLRARGPLGDEYALVGQGKELVFRCKNEHVHLFAFRELLRSDATAEVAALQALGLTVHIASGDAPEKVRAVATALGIPAEHAHGGLSPEDKAALVSRLGADATLVMGDGVNDALAFGTAALAGTPAIDRPTLPARADFVVLGSDLGPLSELVRSARRTRVIMTRNLVIAGAYNTLGLVAGIAGWLSPLVAAIAMPTSSLLVLALTLAAARSPEPRPALASARSPAWMPST